METGLILTAAASILIIGALVVPAKGFFGFISFKIAPLAIGLIVAVMALNYYGYKVAADGAIVEDSMSASIERGIDSVTPEEENVVSKAATKVSDWVKGLNLPTADKGVEVPNK